MPEDKRPAECRFRLRDEGKAYPKSSCAACGRTITTGLGKACHKIAVEAMETACGDAAAVIPPRVHPRDTITQAEINALYYTSQNAPEDQIPHDLRQQAQARLRTLTVDGVIEWTNAYPYLRDFESRRKEKFAEAADGILGSIAARSTRNG